MYTLINKNKLYYEISGHGTPLIMLHGNGESLEIFNKSIEKLRKDFTVYAVDFPGHGKSYALKDPHYEIFAEAIHGFILNLDIKNPVLYGFSDGGIVGLLLAIKYPSLLSKLIVSGANINPRGLKFSARAGMKAEYLFTHLKRIKMMLCEPDIKVSELENIKIPVLITAGENDVIYSKHTKLIADSIPDSKLKIFKKHNHSSYIVNSGIIADYIIEACRQ